MTLWRMLSSPPERLWPEAVVHHGARVLMLAGLALLVTVGFPPNPRVADVSGYEAGVVATEDLIAEVEFAVPKSAAELERDRAAAVAAVPMIYRYRPEAGDSTADALNRFFATVEDTLGADLAALDSVLAAENIAATPALVEMLRDAAVREEVLRAALRAARELIPAGVVDATTRDNLGDRITVLDEGGERFVSAVELLTATDLYNRSAALLPEDASPEATEILRLLLIRFREFSYVPNQQATAARRTAARQSVATTRGNVLTGEAILRANQQVTDEDLVRLRAYEEQLRTLGLLGATATGFLPSLGAYLLQVLLLGMLWIVLWAYRGEVYTNFRWMTLLALLLATYFASAIVISRVAIFPPELLPIAFVTLSVAVVWDGRLALMLALVLAVVTASLTPFQGADVMVTTMVGGGAAALAVGVVRRRSQSWTFIAVIAGSYAFVTLSLWLSRMQPSAGVLPSIGWTTGNAIVSAGLALLFVPAFEWFTGITTDQTLLEFADPNRTLLKRLSMEAPGTYAHTVNVANLAEAAGTAIGANGLLCRVGTYYHDVGKVLEPQYFIENQHGGVNPHDRLDPAISAAILRRHVVEGLRLARQEKLPRPSRPSSPNTMEPSASATSTARRSSRPAKRMWTKASSTTRDRSRSPGRRRWCSWQIPWSRPRAPCAIPPRNASEPWSTRSWTAGLPMASWTRLRSPSRRSRSSRNSSRRCSKRCTTAASTIPKRRISARLAGMNPPRQATTGTNPPRPTTMATDPTRPTAKETGPRPGRTRPPPRPDAAPGTVTGPEVLVDVDSRAAAESAISARGRADLARAVRTTLSDDGTMNGEVSLTLVGDDRIRALNRDYLGRDRVTDVISFALHGPDEPLLADIYIGYPQALRQAAELGLSAHEELVRLAIHGTLHALGYDHPAEDRFASAFFLRQEALVKRVLAAGDGCRENSRASSNPPSSNPP